MMRSGRKCCCSLVVREDQTEGHPGLGSGVSLCPPWSSLPALSRTTGAAFLLPQSGPTQKNTLHHFSQYRSLQDKNILLSLALYNSMLQSLAIW